MPDLLYKAPLVYEPLRKNRFIFSFPSDTGIQSWWVSTSSLPSINQNATEIQFMNTSTWVLGRYTWEDITITFRQFIGPSTSQALMEWVRLESESVTGRQGFDVFVKKHLLENGYISSGDEQLYAISDDPDEILHLINTGYDS
jgi:hypothetical protein